MQGLYRGLAGSYDAVFAPIGRPSGLTGVAPTSRAALAPPLENRPMAMDPGKSPAPPTTGALPMSHHGKGVKIFTYPKIIFIFPTLIMSLICGLGMLMIKDRTADPRRAQDAATVAARNEANRTDEPAVKATDPANPPTTTPADPNSPDRIRRFASIQNLLAVGFLLVFAFNMIVMAVDFPRFTVFAFLLVGVTVLLGVLLLNEHYRIWDPLVNLMEGVYAVANAQFYFLIAAIIGLVFLVIYGTRYLDYWVILPNEILHNHGPFSDLERYPTFNLKFDKEIPDILEYMMLRAGRIVLHVTTERKAIILDNVLFINAKEDKLKQLMSRMEVRVTTDQETAEPM